MCPVKETPKTNKLEKFSKKTYINKVTIKGKNRKALGEFICCLKIDKRKE